jgi:hypothetical protein
MTVPFWVNEPSVLFNKTYIFELFPTSKMTYNRQMNSISRLIILLTIIGYLITMSLKLIFISIATLFIIFLVHQQKEKKEGFSQPLVYKSTCIGNSCGENSSIVNPETLQSFARNEFKEGNKKNPFSNVLLTEILDDPNRNAAPPSFNPSIEEDITTNVKRSVQMMNPGIDNTNKQLFSDLTDKFYLDQSNRAFFSTANTRVSNDQTAFANFLYGDLKYSAKESTPEGAITRVKDSYRYTLY